MNFDGIFGVKCFCRIGKCVKILLSTVYRQVSHFNTYVLTYRLAIIVLSIVFFAVLRL